VSSLPALPDREDWSRLSPLLDELLELPAGPRAARLQEACAGDEALKGHLERLLAADEVGSFLDETAAPFHALVADAADSAPADDAPAAGARCGPWRLVRELGHGGMGTVFLAERADGQFQQQVALKVVKRGMDTDEILRRFLAERQILARLQHPHIARLLDGGVTEDGRPYFVMEHVEGTSIAAYCLGAGLSLEARLRLFQEVCDAVRYAHRNLVVHRDLKPSNILVTAEEKAKLLDFGIAKLLDVEEGLTVTGERVMTPEYAAPEQRRGEPVTTATDVFALGLLLYELVAGRRWQPPRPTDPPRVGQGDLDAILETALREEPEKRYGSVEALSDDVRRFLRGLPVVARKGTPLYRARKFVQRHRVGVWAAALTVLASLVGVGGTTWQARLARAEAAKARTVKDFLVGVFEVSDPNKAQGEQVTARDLLDRGAVRIEREFSAQPELSAELLGLVARLYFRLGFHDRAAPLLEKDLALRRRTYGDDSIEVAESLAQSSDLHHARGDYGRAQALRRQALDIDRRRLGPAHPRTVSDADGLARSLVEHGGYDEASKIIDDTLGRIRADRGEENEDYATALNTREMLHWAQGRYAEAERDMRRVVEIRLRVLGERHTRVAEGFSNLGSLAMARGDAAEAERMYRRALDIGTKLYGEDHPNLGITLNNLAKVVQERGNIEEAILLQRRALAVRTRQLGEGSPQLAVNFHNLALLLRERGEYGEAIRLLNTAVAMNRKLLGDEHVSQAITFGSLALVLGEAARPAEAEPLFRRSLEVFRRKGLEKHMKFPEVLEGLGLLLVDTHRAAEAEALLREAVDRRRQALGDRAWRTAAAKGALARCLRALGRRDEARALASEALPLLLEQRGEAHPSTRLARSVLSQR
jgi:eukaryotic-like serine/threonine-protein kinase